MSLLGEIKKGKDAITSPEVMSGAASGAATGFAVGGPWGAAIGGVVGGAAGYMQYEANQDAEAEAKAQAQNAREAEAMRRNIARQQMLSERRRMSEAPTRFITAPRGSVDNVGIGSTMVSGLQLGESTGLLIPV